MRLSRVLAALISSLLVPTAAFGSPVGVETTGSGAIDIETECSSTGTAIPQDHEAPIVGDYETEVVLDVHVLLVGVDEVVARRIMEHVARVYEPIGIKIAARFETVDLKIKPASSGALLSTSESQAYIDASKAHFGGVRPWWADVVYTMLGPEIAGTVAGQADCVGGIAFPDAAFAVGETEPATDEYQERRSAKIAAHEIAHLLAAHHHLANCAESNKDYFPDDLAACTLLFNDLFMVSLGFSTVNAAVVRAYALEYAKDTPTSPPPDYKPTPVDDPKVAERALTFKINKKKVGRGSVRVTDSGSIACAESVPVALQRQQPDGSWTNVQKNMTNSNAKFAFGIKKAGTYRVRASELGIGGGESCAEAFSPTVVLD